MTTTPALQTVNNVRRARTAAFALLALATTAAAASAQSVNPLLAASSSIETLVQQVSGSVVQIVVTGLRPVDGEGGRAIGRGRSIGSGFVVDHGGYIVTNAHVIEGAEQIDVLVADDARRTLPNRARTVRAAIVGVAGEWDLALLKVDVDLPPLRLADYDAVRQGQLVFAFGSPDGLRNSVSMGMVSAVARQLERDSPLVYIQTDAAINPGNSGGPLVNVRGEVIGIDTLIRSAAGGSDGLGFALPSSLIALAYPQLRESGRLRRSVIGISTQSVTPLIAEGLHLGAVRGQIIADVAADSPAAAAGLRVGDIVTAVDGRDVDEDDAGRLYLHLSSLRSGQRVTVDVVRDGRPLTFTAAAVEVAADTSVSMLDSASIEVAPLAILGLPYRDDAVSGVVVAARLDMPHAPGPDLATGDVIVAVNGTNVDSVPALRRLLAAAGSRGAVVLQVARGGRLSYMPFVMD